MSRPNPRDVLASSLRLLIDAAGITSPTVADRAGVDPKTLNNMLNARFGTRLDNIEKVANVLHFEVWQLLMPGYVEAFVKDGANLRKLVAAYMSTDDSGRHSILSVAEMAARSVKAPA